MRFKLYMIISYSYLKLYWNYHFCDESDMVHDDLRVRDGGSGENLRPDWFETEHRDRVLIAAERKAL